MPIYWLLFVCVCVCLFIRTVTDFSAEDKASGVIFSYFARRFIDVQCRESPILGNFAPQEPKIGRIVKRAGHAHPHVNITVQMRRRNRHARDELFVKLRRIGMCGYTSVPNTEVLVGGGSIILRLAFPYLHPCTRFEVDPPISKTEWETKLINVHVTLATPFEVVCHDDMPWLINVVNLRSLDSLVPNIGITVTRILPIVVWVVWSLKVIKNCFGRFPLALRSHYVHLIPFPVSESNFFY